MKRKRGGKKNDKKTKKKKLAVVSTHLLPKVGVVKEDGILDLDSADEGSQESIKEIGVPLDEPDLESEEPIATMGEKSVIGSISGLLPVKVKLKSSTIVDGHRTPSERQAQSVAGKSDSVVVLEKQEPIAKEEEDFGSQILHDIGPVSGPVLSVYSSRKAKRMKLKTAKYMADQGLQMQEEGQGNDKSVGSHEDKKLPHQYEKYNEKELTTAVEVIKKVMKMDAADPFNAPVDPVALGIPDYFDIITKPMDFGTILANLEDRLKYLNSEDVFKDVECIWENCLRYNNKGDYVIELMKRVKKNYSKLWTEAGLYSIPSNSNVGASCNEMIPCKEMNRAILSNKEKPHLKVLSAKQSKKKRQGIDSHKSDCLCAACVMRRKKQTQDSPLKDNSVVRLDNSLQRNSEDASFTLNQSLKHNENDFIKGQEIVGQLDNRSVSVSFNLHKQAISGSAIEILEERGEKTSVRGDDTNVNNDHRDLEENGLDHEGQLIDRNDESCDEGLPPDKNTDLNEQELVAQHQPTPMHLYENPAVLALREMLFPKESKSIWNGPHSLVPRSQNCGSGRDSRVLAAFATFISSLRGQSLG